MPAPRPKRIAAAQLTRRVLLDQSLKARIHAQWAVSKSGKIDNHRKFSRLATGPLRQKRANCFRVGEQRITSKFQTFDRTLRCFTNRGTAVASVPKDQQLRDGEIELSLTLGNLEEIERWILSWGSHAQVLAPSELRERIAKTVAALSETYHTPV
jgi:hypothetical protein